MWTKHSSFFMMVRVRTGGFRLAIPLPIFVLDQALKALEDLCWLADRFRPGWRRGWRRASARHLRLNLPSKCHSRDLPLEPAIRLCRELLAELRRYGTWRMVEVETEDPGSGKVRIYIDFI